MPKKRTEPPELPTPLTTDMDELSEVLDDGLVPPAGIDDDPEFERVVHVPD